MARNVNKPLWWPGRVCVTSTGTYPFYLLKFYYVLLLELSIKISRKFIIVFIEQKNKVFKNFLIEGVNISQYLACNLKKKIDSQ